MKPRLKLVCSSIVLLCALPGGARAADVTAKFAAVGRGAAAPRRSSRHPPMNDIVLWLTRLDDGTPARTVALPRSGYRLVQKDKMFSPHLLVVPTGSSVEFPNLDPFFHNVFSLFSGKRFDLGLYESGARRSEKFDREGVSYIFCNIHPEMGAIILALNSPYFGVSDTEGAVTIRDVPPGRYVVHMWSEQFQSAEQGVEHGVVQVTPRGATLGTIALAPAPNPLTRHKNKFGEDYPAIPSATY